MAQASTLNCPMCGAAAQSDATKCEHCGARLATVACPSCFAMIFDGSRFCPFCGARADREVGEATVFPCPRCEDHPTLTRVTLGKAMLNECGKCEGLWIDKFSFEQICNDRDQQAAILGPAIRLPIAEPSHDKIIYLHCPECAEIMQRMNFAGCSGVIIDICREHGSWFDNKELQRIIDFIRAGGLERQREKQIAELEEARRRLESQKRANAWATVEHQGSRGDYNGVIDAVWAAGELLAHFINKR
jgi:Zn-finger nucleic acid-binding protein